MRRASNSSDLTIRSPCFSLLPAQYGYAAQHEGSDELDLRVGEILTITERSFESAEGWSAGVNAAGRAGVFPTSHIRFLNVAPSPTQAAADGAHSGSVMIHVDSPAGAASSAGASSSSAAAAASGPSSSSAAKSVNRRASLANVPVNENVRRRQTLFCLYAHYSAMMSGTFYSATGLILLLWGAQGRSPVPGFSNPRLFSYLDVGIGLAALILGFLIVLYEIRFGEARAGVNLWPFRGIFYTLAAVPGFFAFPTGVGAILVMFPALVNFYSSFIGESYRPPVPPKPAAKKGAGRIDISNPAAAAGAAGAVSSSGAAASPGRSAAEGAAENEDEIGTCGQIMAFIGGQNPDRQVGRIVFFVIYVAANIVAGAFHAKQACDDIDAAIAFNEARVDPQIPEMPYHTQWRCGAKFFGNIMNLNYTLILLPVSHSLMRWLVDNSRARTCVGGLLRGVLWILPVDDAIKIHKLMAIVAFCAAIGHTICHLFNYVARAELVMEQLGVSIFVTGIMLLCFLFIMYPATCIQVKRGHFEIFWITHMLYVGVFVVTFIHGRGMLGPNYWKWLLLPGTVYFIERVYREVVTRKPVNVISVTFMSNAVLSVVVSKSGPLAQYSEGQYAYICCPAISSFQWHPFTISSAPQEDYVSFHIRVQDKGSWTYRLRDFFRIIGSGSTKPCLKFAHLEDNQVVPGLVDGPSGEPLLRIHGPYSAPTQHFCEYNEVMVCASGIGVTPLASALKSIAHFRWQFGVNKTYPDSATFIWVAAHKEIPSFRWLVRTVKESQDAIFHLRSKASQAENSKRKLRILVYITSYSQSEADKFMRLSEEEKDEEETGLWGLSYFDSNSGLARKTAPFTEMQLYTALMKPSKGTVTMGDVSITLGRPKWDEIFAGVQTTTAERDVGVTFCGNPLIGKDLKSNCLKFTHKEGGKITWHLHKEVF